MYKMLKKENLCILILVLIIMLFDNQINILTNGYYESDLIKFN